MPIPNCCIARCRIWFSMRWTRCRRAAQLTLSARPRGDQIEIRVADTGAGLTPEECERLFTPYYTTKQHGTGLGLAIVQSVVADHAGTITVESRPGGGAVFVIALPKASEAKS